MISDQHAETMTFELDDQLLDFGNGNRVNARQWFIKQEECRPGGEGACDLNPRRSPPERVSALACRWAMLNSVNSSSSMMLRISGSSR